MEDENWIQNENPASREEILLRKRKNERYNIIWGYVFKLRTLLQEKIEIY